MIKLIPCPNISKRDLFKAIESGRTFSTVMTAINPSDHLIHWDDNHGNNPVRCGTKPWNWRGFKYLFEITESHWYDNISHKNPAACRVWDHSEDTTLALIYERDADGYFKCTAGDSWACAELLTKKDLYQEPV